MLRALSFSNNRFCRPPSQVKLTRPLHIVISELNSSKDTTAILSSLQTAYPVAQTPEHEQLQQLLGHINLDIVFQVTLAQRERY